MREQQLYKARATINSTLETVNKYIIVVSIAAQLSVFFTAARIVQTQNSVGQSALSVLISLSLSLIWFFHGLYNKKWAAVITTSIAILGNIIVLFLIYKYRNPQVDDYNFPTFNELKQDENAIIKEYHPEIYSGHNSGYVIINSS